MFNLASQTFIFSKEFTCVLYVFREINSRIWCVTKALRIRGYWVSFKFTRCFLIITWLGRFFFSSGLNSNTDGTLPGKYVFLPIPKDTRICFGLKWNSQTMTFFVLLNLSAPPVRLYLLITSYHVLRNAGSSDNLKSTNQFLLYLHHKRHFDILECNNKPPNHLYNFSEDVSCLNFDVSRYHSFIL